MDSYNIDEKLHCIYKHAMAQVGYYRQTFEEKGLTADFVNSAEDVSNAPVLTQQAAQEKMSDLLADSYQKYPSINKLVVQRSLSSKGLYLKALWDIDDLRAAEDTLWYYREANYGIKPEMRTGAFHTAYYADNLIMDIRQSIQDQNSLSLYNQGLFSGTVLDAYKSLLDFEPDYLLLSPSVALQLADVKLQNGLPTLESLQYIELTGERLRTGWRKRLQDIFKVPMASSYGIKGVGPIAYECPCGRMHVLQDNVLLEIVKDGEVAPYGVVGEIIVTSLKNQAMPFLRYQTGDTGVLYESACACGNTEPILELRSCKEADLIPINDQNVVNSASIVGLIEYTNEYMSSAISRVRLERQNNTCLKIVLKPSFRGWEKAVKAELLKQANRMGWAALDWKIEFEDWSEEEE